MLYGMDITGLDDFEIKLLGKKVRRALIYSSAVLAPL